MKLKGWTTISAAVLAAAMMAPAFAADTTQPAGPQASRHDKEFVREAGYDGQLEVKLGQLAALHGQNAQVKDFGTRMVTDHAKANAALQQAAMQAGADCPTAVSKHGQEEYQRLEKLSGSAFDQAYIKFEVKDHQNDVKDFKEEQAKGESPAIKQFAQQYQPVIQQHLEMARNIESQLEGTANNK